MSQRNETLSPVQPYFSEVLDIAGRLGLVSLSRLAPDTQILIEFSSDEANGNILPREFEVKLIVPEEGRASVLRDSEKVLGSGQIIVIAGSLTDKDKPARGDNILVYEIVQGSYLRVTKSGKKGFSHNFSFPISQVRIHNTQLFRR